MPAPTNITLSQISGKTRPFQPQNRTHTITDVLAPGGSGPAGVYIHVPFCFHKCHYCDFYSIVDQRDRQPRFVERLIEEMAASEQFIQAPVETIFVGGGTPTLLPPASWKSLLRAMQTMIPRARDAEFTIEANPETVTAELADVLAMERAGEVGSGGGVNRVSIGCQSFHPGHLKTLERWHDPANVERAAGLFRAAGITNINLDLIFAIPGQSLDDWLADLDQALALSPSHLSCYSLMYEPNTPLTARMKAGAIEPVEQELEAAMYEAAIDRLALAGFEHYEISNWARPGMRCRHNMLYWTNADWWPLGPSASGHCNGLRWKNVARLDDYLDHGTLPPITGVERLDADGRVGEELMLGLRLIDGLSLDHLDELLARGERGRERSRTLQRHVEDGLIERDERGVRLTRRGLMLADSVIAALL